MSFTPTRRSILATILVSLLVPHGSCAPGSGEFRQQTPAAGLGVAPAQPTAPGAGAEPAPPPPAATTPTTTTTAPPLRVLFIGNSYTFYNGGVDAVLQALAASRGRPMECAASTSGGKTLQWHWEEGDARAEIARGGWDYVVLQEFSTRPIVDPNAMFTFARRFDAEIKNAGAKTVFYLTWARFHQPENQIVISRAYDTIADELNALVARVGPAWERALEERPSLKLHADDRSHPAPAGTYLAACVFYATLTGESPVGLPARLKTSSGKTIDLDAEDADVMQRAARAVSTPGRRTESPRKRDG